MLHKTKGIVINFIKYKESSIITKIYTEKFGLQTYIENGVRSSKGKNKIALFQPLTLLDLVVYHDHKKEIHRISEIKCSTSFRSIPYELKKSCSALFLNEVLNKSLKESSENEALFGFLTDAILYLDSHDHQIENFHLYFLLNYCFYLGFAPENGKEIFDQFFSFSYQIPHDLETINFIDQIIHKDFGDALLLTRIQRNQVLDVILAFYRLHVEDFGELRSLAVLKEILG